MTEDRRDLYRLFAQLLEYPQPDLPARAKLCLELLSAAQSEAVAPMEDFLAFLETTSTGRREEIYSATFDLSPECCPYVGFQLFGENPKRTDLMVRLQESYKSSGFSSGSELPDHVAQLLRFLAQQQDEDMERDLVDYLVAPTLKKMAQSLGDRNPYGAVLRAASLVYRQEVEERAGTGENPGDLTEAGAVQPCSLFPEVPMSSCESPRGGDSHA